MSDDQGLTQPMTTAEDRSDNLATPRNKDSPKGRTISKCYSNFVTRPSTPRDKKVDTSDCNSSKPKKNKVSANNPVFVP